MSALTSFRTARTQSRLCQGARRDGHRLPSETSTNIQPGTSRWYGTNAEGLELATRIMSLAIQEGEVLSHAVDHPRTIPQAQDLARSALRMMGQDPSVSRARALSILGQHADSVRTWKALIEADREDADLWDGLSRAMMEAGDQATAQRCAQKAASLRQGARSIISRAFDRCRFILVPRGLVGTNRPHVGT